MKKLSIVVPCYNEIVYTKNCLHNLRDVCDMDATELIFVDDFSLDGTQEWLKQQEDIVFVPQHKNMGVTFSRNHWVSYATWEYICVINNDTEFPKWFFEKMMGWTGDGEDWVLMSCPRFTQKFEDYWKRIFYFDKHIAGFCFMMNRKWVEFLFPINERLRIFWNDNRLYQKCIYGWYKLKLVRDAVMYHYKGRTVWKVENRDMPIYLDICRENWRQVVPVETPDTDPWSDLVFSL